MMMVIIKVECISPRGFINVNYTEGIIVKIYLPVSQEQDTLCRSFFSYLCSSFSGGQNYLIWERERYMESMLNTEDAEQQSSPC